MNTYYNFKLYNMRGRENGSKFISLSDFYTVANTQNISKAASELFISQPAISKSLRKLEENLNLSLFIRNSRGVTLTSEGKHCTLMSHRHSTPCRQARKNCGRYRNSVSVISASE